VTTCWTCWFPVTAWNVSLVELTRAPYWLLYRETEIVTVSPWVAGGRLNPNCPLKVVPPSVDCRTLFTVPRATFEVASYALPVAYSWLPKLVVQVADMGTVIGTLE
jgi:hypothetical protein